MKRAILFLLVLPLAITVLATEPELLVDLRGQWRFNLGDNQDWSDDCYDDTDWEQIFVPSRWENEGFGGYDGYAWYRKNFALKSVNDADSYFLDLGYIDDVDEVYVNGQLIGFSGAFPPKFRTAYDSHRKYQVPAALLKAGQNLIAVRVYDVTLDGGIMKGRQGLYVKHNALQAVLSLEGVWRFQAGDSPEWREKGYNDNNWQKVIAPGYWESYKIMGLEMRIQSVRRCWYRKNFTLPDGLKREEELVVVLGKIDDYDEVYLNGQLIGKTNDQKPFGESRSYDQYRIYVLLNKYLIRDGENTLAVRVTDIGFDAGIYKGPLAIVPMSDYKILIRNY